MATKFHGWVSEGTDVSRVLRELETELREGGAKDLAERMQLAIDLHENEYVHVSYIDRYDLRQEKSVQKISFVLGLAMMGLIWWLCT